MGKPLIVYTIEQACACSRIDSVYVSTDSDAIAEVAREAGAIVPFRRPAELAQDTTPKMPVIQHLVKWVEQSNHQVQRIVDLDPTSPLREVSDIDACIALLGVETDVVITGYESEKNPYFNMVEMASDGRVQLVKAPAQEITGRQAAPKVYAMNASIYVWHRHSLDKGLWGGVAKIHVMPRARSVDIDSELDFRIVELLMRDRLLSR